MIPCWRWRTEFKRIKATPTYKCIYKIQEQKQNPKLKKKTKQNKKHKRRQIMQRQRRQTPSAAAGEEFRFGLELGGSRGLGSNGHVCGFVFGYVK